MLRRCPPVRTSRSLVRRVPSQVERRSVRVRVEPPPTACARQRAKCYRSADPTGLRWSRPEAGRQARRSRKAPGVSRPIPTRSWAESTESPNREDLRGQEFSLSRPASGFRPPRYPLTEYGEGTTLSPCVLRDGCARSNPSIRNRAKRRFVRRSIPETDRPGDRRTFREQLRQEKFSVARKPVPLIEKGDRWLASASSECGVK